MTRPRSSSDDSGFCHTDAREPTAPRSQCDLRGDRRLLHGHIFTLESVIWCQPTMWMISGIRTQRDADIIKPMAFNQGFYKLFLTVETGLGVILLAVSLPVVVTLLVVSAS